MAATTTVGLATLAFFAGAGGLGEQIFGDINFKSNVVTAGGLCVLLAVSARPRASPRPASRHPVESRMNEFGDAIEFIFKSRETNEGVRVGGSQFFDLAVDHMWLSLVATAIACAIAIPLGLWLGHIGRGGFLAINVSNVGRAVPSLALIAFFVAYLGVGFANVTLALVLLAVPPILTNTYVGVTPGGPGHGRSRARHGDDRARRSSGGSSSRSPCRSSSEGSARPQ